MTDEAEKRFEKAMSKIFHSKLPSTPTSSTGTPSTKEPSQGGKASLQGQISRASSLSRNGGLPPRLTTNNLRPTSSLANSSLPTCRPWDRGDLLRRLSTFKSMRWFGKPKTIGPLNCARRGWLNIDMDMLACESCGSRLSFSTPPSWPQHQVEKAAESFSIKLDEGHKSLCPWKGNECEESLAHFPPTPSHALVESYRDRCDALLELPALPVISKSAVEEIKLSHAQQIDRLLSQPPPSAPLFRNCGKSSSPEMMDDDSTLVSTNLYYQAQRLISLCGWELRLLPYVVDCEDHSTQPVKDAHLGESSPGIAVHSPTVLLCSRIGTNEVLESSQNKSTGNQRKPEPASAVLDCSLCGASVGMWAFNVVYRPLHFAGNDSVECSAKPTDSNMRGISAASFVGAASSEARDKEHLDEIGEAMTSSSQKIVSEERILDLSLTIAGGLPPTKQNVLFQRPLLSLTEKTKVGLHSSSEIGEWVSSSESREPQNKIHSAAPCCGSPQNRRETTESINIERDGLNSTWSVKRKRKDVSSEVSRGFSQGGHGKPSERLSDSECNTIKRQKRDSHTISERFALELANSEFHGVSSVNAVDTCYHDRRENSTESVDNVPQFSCKSFEGIEEGTATNIATISTGRVGGVSIGMSGFPEASGTQTDAQGDTGIDFSVNRDESRAAESEVLAETGRSGRGEVSSLGAKTGCVSVCEDSQHALLINQTGRNVLGDASSMDEKIGCASFCEESQHAVLVNHAAADMALSRDSGIEIKTCGEKSEVCQPHYSFEKQEKSDAVITGHQSSSAETNTTVPAAQLEAAKLDNQMETGSGRDLDTGLWGKTLEFDPIKQHRHFCPWVTAIGVSSGDKYTSLCGWQLTLDAVDQCNAQELATASLKESESTSSRFKVNPVNSVRKLFETPSAKKGKHSHVQSSTRT
eukprot:TRINITY_DN1818_c0_g1_i1.p1 TRINITY_DN1818_c0_g1~~TRINITY_DN1818_c0_g1_i1.p1  ORF type:complete len:924 (-),score=191.65 TRINITY_DN1818_c0_g1_i1:298-3069(-)